MATLIAMHYRLVGPAQPGATLFIAGSAGLT